MKNTGTEYMSTERTPTVRPDFAELLPPLSDEQLSLLEADILKNGCYAPVIVNEDMVIVDGHNLASICDKHGVPYRMAVFFLKMTWKPSSGRWIRRKAGATWKNGSWARSPSSSSRRSRPGQKQIWLLAAEIKRAKLHYRVRQNCQTRSLKQ